MASHSLARWAASDCFCDHCSPFFVPSFIMDVIQEDSV
jgi:hypothetical protein